MRKKASKPAIWTQEEIDIVMANYKKMIRREVHKLLVEAGSDKTFEQVIYYYKNHGLKNGIDMSFKKGNIPPMKGKKAPPHIVEALRATMFKKGNRPHNAVPVGTIITKTDGYLNIKIAEPNKWELLHRYVWEQHNGKIPKNSCVVFLDGDKTNCSIENLTIISRAENCRINNDFKTFDSPEQRQVQIDIVKINTALRKVGK